MSRLLFDIESDGFVEKMTKVHCIVTHDLDTEETRTFDSDTPGSLGDALIYLEGADELVGHNIVNFDIPALQKIYPGFKPTGKLTDTLCISRLIWADIKERDFRKDSKVPAQLRGRHSLESWGHRLGLHKGDYAKMMKEKGLDPWAEFNADMLAYCIDDVHLNVALWRLIERRNYSEQAIRLEHAVWQMCLAQEARGVCFNEQVAVDLYGRLIQMKVEAENELKATFGSWYQDGGEFTPKRPNKTHGYVAGATFRKVRLIEFNPGSRQHIADRLMKLRGWKPTQFTAAGRPQVDESVVSKLKYPEAKKILRYLLLDKRIGQIAEGEQAWLKKCKEGRIHGRVNSNGAVTGRATHSHPNLGQVPKVGVAFGTECRSLFRATPGMVMVGADASGLELRCLAHYLSRYDGGAYADAVVKGRQEDGTDAHSVNMRNAGLTDRNQAKTFIYALLYGAGDGKIGSIVGKGPGAGRALRNRFMSAMPAYKRLSEGVKKAAKKRGRLMSIDGRVLSCRSEHSSLNTLLQGAGAIIMKQAMVNYQADLRAQGIPFHQVLWIHDEFQVECSPEHAETVGQAMVDGIRLCTEQFNFGCPLDGEYKIGATWAETH